MLNSNEEILKELVGLAKVQSSLSQFKSLAGAYQYFLLYQVTNKDLKPGIKVLDWGAGNGHFSYFLCRRGFKAVGFSFEGSSFKKWLPRSNYRFIKGKVSKPVELPFKKNSFNAVFSVGVLEHVREFKGSEVKSLKEIYRILKPSGVFICYHLPNKLSFIDFLARLVFRKPSPHKYRFSESDIRKLVKMSGLKLIQVRRYGMLPRNSLGNLPGFLKYSETFATIYNSLDNIFTKLFSLFCQNYFFVAKKQRGI